MCMWARQNWNDPLLDCLNPVRAAVIGWIDVWSCGNNNNNDEDETRRLSRLSNARNVCITDLSSYTAGKASKYPWVLFVLDCYGDRFYWGVCRGKTVRLTTNTQTYEQYPYLKRVLLPVDMLSVHVTNRMQTDGLYVLPVSKRGWDSCRRCSVSSS